MISGRQPRGQFGFAVNVPGVLGFKPRGTQREIFLQFNDRGVLGAYEFEGEQQVLVEPREFIDLVGDPRRNSAMWRSAMQHAPDLERLQLVVRVCEVVFDEACMQHGEWGKKDFEATASRRLVLTLRDAIRDGIREPLFWDREGRKDFDMAAILVERLGPVLIEHEAIKILRHFLRKPSFEVDLPYAVQRALRHPRHRTPDMLAVHLTVEVLKQAGVSRSEEQVRDDLGNLDHALAQKHPVIQQLLSGIVTPPK